MAGSSAILRKNSNESNKFNRTILEIPPRQLCACYPNRPNMPGYLDLGRKGE
jgi:hypothetical protein